MNARNVRRQWGWVCGGLLWVLTLSAAQSAPSPKKPERTQAFVVALNDDYDHTARKLTLVFREVMLEAQGIEVLDLANRLGRAAPKQVLQLRKKANQALVAARQAKIDLELEQISVLARQARESFENMGGYLAPLAGYKESLLLLAIGEAMQGHRKMALSAFFDLLILDPRFPASQIKAESFVVNLFKEAKQGVAKRARGSLSIKSQPPGSNIYVDGKLVGISPDSIDGLVAGRHLVMLKRPGYQHWGKVVRVEAGNLVSLNVEMKGGKAGAGFESMVRRAGQAVSDRNLVGQVIRLGQVIGLDWVVLSQLDQDPGEIILTAYLFDYKTSRVAHRANITIDAHSYSVNEDIHNFGKIFLVQGRAALEKMRKEGDPLSGRLGTEDWDRNESESAHEHRQTEAAQEHKRRPPQERSGDPLDRIDGTEDW